MDYQEVSALAKVVRENTPRGDAEVFRRVIGIARSKRQALTSRLVGLELACEIADAQAARELVEMMNVTLQELRRGRDSGHPSGHPEGVPTKILSRFIERGAQHLIGLMSDQGELLGFLKSSYLQRGLHPKTKSTCARLIAECNAPLAARQQAVLEIIEARSARVLIRPALLRILDGSVFPKLRRMVRAETTPTEFNFAAANALSYLGDEQIVPDLEARRPAFRAVHENREAILRQYVWRIEIQHPPTKILEYIASVDDRGYREMRMWAVQRAHEIGVEPGAIRQAILQHVANASTPLERGEISYVKWMGMELGILHENDLPDVEIRDRGITP